MEKEGSAVWHREVGSLSWVVLDYVDVVVHIFQKTARSYYNLERLWGDAKIVTVKDAAGAPKRVSRSPEKGRSPRKSSAAKKRPATKRVTKGRRTSAVRLSTKAAS